MCCDGIVRHAATNSIDRATVRSVATAIELSTTRHSRSTSARFVIHARIDVAVEQ